MKSQLFYIACDNCGAEYRINSRGEMNCPFCGSKIYLNDKDFEEYLKVRDEMLTKDKVENDNVNLNGDVLNKWSNDMIVNLKSKNGKTINIRYCFHFERPNKTVYVNKTRVIVIYKDIDTAGEALFNVKSLNYPSADIKDLAQFFPSIGATIVLEDGRCLVSYNKPENVYPLAIFPKLDPKQVAWMISRMENFGCLFEFNGIDFTKIEKEDLYFNPKTHQMYILDGWEYVFQRKVSDNYYLLWVREIMKNLMYPGRAPKMCEEFLASRPAETAYEDFEKWDKVIEKGFNGHNFHHFTED